MIIHSLISDVNLRSTYDADFQRRMGQQAIRSNETRRKAQCALVLNSIIGDSNSADSDDEGSLSSWAFDQESGGDDSDTDTSLADEVFVSHNFVLYSYFGI